MKSGILKTFTRSQFASLAATLADFGTLVCLVEFAHVWYVAATAMGALVGGVTNFLMGRHWSFTAADGHVHHQAGRYALVSGMSLILNSTGVFFLTDHFGLKYALSKAITAVLVGILFNFPMHRAYVFR